MKKFYRLIYVVVGIVLTIVAIKTFYDASLVNNKKGWYVIEGSIVDTELQVTHPEDIYYIEEDKVDFNKNADKFEYSIQSDGTISLNEYKGKNSILVIPSEINGKKISVVNFSGKFRQIKVPSTVKAITGNLELTDEINESIVTAVAVFVVTLLVYITVLLASTKKFNLKIAFTSLMYLLVPIVYTLATKKYLVIKSSYDYTYLALMTVTTIIYIIIVAIIAGFSKEPVEVKPTKKVAAKKATTVKKTATAKKAPAKKKTTTKKK